jgi:hypothetical protein
MANEPAIFPTAAQVAKNKADVELAIKQAITAMNLKIRALELASQFPAANPLALAREIYDFIREDTQ